jgi:uncharacterized membrane protein YhfC
MLFILLTAVSGIILFIVPMVLAGKFSKRWNIPKRAFWKAGLALLIIEVFQLAVIGNATSTWPSLLEMPLIAKAAIFGIFYGLFYELGRFVVLDKVMKNVRSFRQGFYFALGWSGVETMVLGIAIFVGSIGMMVIINNKDIATSFPNMPPDQIEMMTEYQKQSQELIQGNPLLGLAPVLERSCQFLFDVAVTLILVFSMTKLQPRMVWVAVGLRAFFGGSLIYLGSINLLAGEFVFIVFAVFAYFIIKKIRPMVPAH